MSLDIGTITKDDEDSPPESPLTALTGLAAVPNRKQKPKLLRRLNDFDPKQDVNKDPQKPRDMWWGTILDIDTFNVVEGKKYYEVHLQDGQFVQAFYPDENVNTKWNDNQRVQVTFDGTDYMILTTPLQKELHLWWEAKDTLRPGEEANGTLYNYNEEDAEFKSFEGEITIKDTYHRNFVLRGEKIQVRLNDLSYEPIGSFGLRRKAKSKVKITTSGLVTIYTKDEKAKEPKDEPDEAQDQDVEVTAWLNWGGGGRPFEADKEIFIEYFTDEEKWVVAGGEC